MRLALSQLLTPQLGVDVKQHTQVRLVRLCFLRIDQGDDALPIRGDIEVREWADVRQPLREPLSGLVRQEQQARAIEARARSIDIPGEARSVVDITQLPNGSRPGKK